MAEALWYSAPGQADIRQEALAPPAADEVRVRALFGAVSRGTEALVLAGRVPVSEFERMRAPFMAGNFPFPVKYGYATVGRIEGGAEALRRAHGLHAPPAPEFLQHPGECRRGAAGQSAAATRGAGRQYGDRAQRGLGCRRRARPTASLSSGPAWSAPWSRICAGGFPARRSRSSTSTRRARNWHKLLGLALQRPKSAKGDCDLVVHASGNPAGLGTALALAGEEATVLEMSWYGDAPVTAPLGGAFHSRRLRLISSQVGQIAPSHRPRWSHGRRLAAALALLTDARLDALLAPPVLFQDLAQRLPDILDAKEWHTLPAHCLPLRRSLVCR